MGACPDESADRARESRMSLPVTKTILPSGITLLVHPMADRHTVSLGVWVRTGARDEPADRAIRHGGHQRRQSLRGESLSFFVCHG